MRLRQVLGVAAALVVVGGIVLVAEVKTIDVERYRGAVADAAEAATGRKLSIDGPLSLRLSLNPALVAENVTFANAGWGSRPAMLTVKRIEAEVALLPLIRREVQVNRLVLVEPDVLLEKNAKGEVNWQFGEPAPGPAPTVEKTAGTPTVFRIGDVRMDNARITYRDATQGIDQTLSIAKLRMDAAGPTAPVGITMTGDWRDRHIDFSGTLGGFGDLGAKKPYPVQLKAVMGGIVATLDGTVTLSRDRPSLSVKATVDAPEIADIAKMANVSLPPMGGGRVVATITGPVDAPGVSALEATVGRKGKLAVTAKGTIKDLAAFDGLDLIASAEGDAQGMKALNLPVAANGFKLSGHLVQGKGQWHLSDLKASAGASDLSGDAVLTERDERPAIEAHLTSTAFDLGDLWQVESPAAPEKAPAASGPPGRAADKMFSDAPLPFGALQAADADIDWTIGRLADRALVAGKARLVLRLKAGRLDLQVDADELAGGRFSASTMIDAGAKPPHVTLQATGDKVALGQILSGLKLTQTVSGVPTDLRLNLKGRGDSQRALMAHLNGELAVVGGEGKVSHTDANLLAVDLLRQLSPWADRQTADLKCMVSRFVVTNGLAKSEAMLLDTNLMTVSGRGSINLGTETLDMTLVPKPKNASLLSLAVPLDIGGSLTAPSVSPNEGAIVRGVAGAIGGLAVGPLGLLVPFVSAGSSSDNPCVAAIAELRQPASSSKHHKAGQTRSSAEGLTDVLKGLLGH